MELDRLLGHPEQLRHLRVRRAARGEPQDLELALGQAVGVPPLVPDRPELGDGQLAAVVDAAVAGVDHGAKRLNEIFWLDALADEAHGSGCERAMDDGLVVGGRDDHDPQGGVERREPPDAGDAVHFGHAEIEQHCIGLALVGQLEHLGAGAGGAENVDAGLLEGQLESGEEERMIVSQDDSRHS